MNRRKLALITGAAGGIGGAVSKRFLREGYQVILLDKDEQALERKFGKISSRDAVRIVADLEDASALQSLRHRANNAVTGLSAAVFCHGGCTVNGAPFPDVKYWEMNYRNNMITSVNAVQACADGLRRACGNLVIIGSVDAILGLEGAGPYDAAKAAQLSLAKGIARAYAPEICAITLVLGTVATDAWRQAAELDPGILDQRGNENLAGQVISPGEVAGLAWLLCQKEARIMRGQSVIADNGWSFLAGTFRFDRRSRPSAVTQGWDCATVNNGGKTTSGPEPRPASRAIKPLSSSQTHGKLKHD